MKKGIIQYGSTVDAFVAVAKRLSLYENRYRLASEWFRERDIDFKLAA
jgi:hypothetical protein